MPEVIADNPKNPENPQNLSIISRACLRLVDLYLKKVGKQREDCLAALAIERYDSVTCGIKVYNRLNRDNTKESLERLEFIKKIFGGELPDWFVNLANWVHFAINLGEGAVTIIVPTLGQSLTALVKAATGLNCNTDDIPSISESIEDADRSQRLEAGVVKRARLSGSPSILTNKQLVIIETSYGKLPERPGQTMVFDDGKCQIFVTKQEDGTYEGCFGQRP